MDPIVECVPNFSEGRDSKVIQLIADAIASIEGVKLLNVDPGKSTNRTVYTFVGKPDVVAEAAFQGIKVAQELIDMRKHKGEHPRMGATDVCPFVPIANISIEECIKYAHFLASRVGNELLIPVYLYGYAATTPDRKTLSHIRSGEYEGFSQKIYLPEWKPDYGPQEFNPLSGQTVIGVRDILIAYNVNLNTTSVKRANSVAFDVREAGRVLTDEKGKTLKDENGTPLRKPGKLKNVQGIGWFIEEFGFAQVSMNITNSRETPLHIVFDEVEKSAFQRGIRVTGSEIVGLVPKGSLVEAGKFFLRKQNRSVGLNEDELIKIAIKTMGLSELYTFDPDQKVIEFVMNGGESKNLVDLSVCKFTHEVASESPAPGGGSVAALCGALGTSLGAMVANLSANKKGWEDQISTFGEIAEQLQAFNQLFLKLVDDDTAAFNEVMSAYRLPRTTPDEVALADHTIEQANKKAASTPLTVMQNAIKIYDSLERLTEIGNPNSITDIGVGALCINTAIQGAGLNVLVNLGSIKDESFKYEMKVAVELLSFQSLSQLDIILAKVSSQISG